MTRREMLAATGLMAAGGSLLAGPAPAMPAIQSPGRLFNVRDFGAAADGKTLDSAAINRAVEACHAAGGGVVYLPPGTYRSGTVILRSHVTLYLEAGATLLGSQNLEDYAPQPGPPPHADANQRHLIFARDAHDVTLAGPGRIDGQGPSFWAPSGRIKPPPQDAWRDVATYDWKALARPSPMLEFYNCTRLRIQDVRIENSPGWTMRPIHCDDVLIQGIHVKNPVHGPNTDGMDVTCCRNVFISNCLVETGDDAICLKSENPYGEELRVSKNITITNCVLSSCCNGFKFGTATRGGFENVVISNSVIFNNDVPLNQRVISGIALEMVDGGWLEGVLISNIRMQRVRTPIFIRRANRTPRPDGTPGALRGVMIENIHATQSILTSSITGLPGFDVEDVTLSNIRIDSEEGGSADWAGRAVPELAKSYPEARDFGRLPSYGLYCRHVSGLRLRNLEFTSASNEARPAICCDDVKDLEIARLRGKPIAGRQPMIKLVSVQQALLQGCSAPAGTAAFVEIQGARTQDVVVAGNNLIGADRAAQPAADVPSGAVTIAGNVTRAPNRDDATS